MRSGFWQTGAALTVIALAAWMMRDSENGSSATATAALGEPVAQPNTKSGAMPFFTSLSMNPLPPKSHSKAKEIERLTATGDPADAYKAFDLASTCRVTRHMRRFFPGTFSLDEERELCGDITELQIRVMTKNLDKAVAADIPHALLGKYYYGPDGDMSALDQRADDPYLADWKRSMLREMTAYVQRTGDSSTMSELVGIYNHGRLGVKDPELAFGYLLARQELNLRSSDVRLRRNALSTAATGSGFAKRLTPEQIAGAKAFAANFIANCCNKR